MLQTGQPVTVTIQARKKWNNTGIRLMAGQEYQFTVVGQWVDWTIRCGTDGYVSSNWVLRVSDWLRHVPHENWLALIDALDFEKKHL